MWNEKNINAFLGLFFGLLVIGFLFHQSRTFAGSAPGHLLGIAGTILILMTLIYPFRKRILKKKGKQNPLNSHVTYGLIGPSLVVIHSAHKFSSLVGVLIFISLVLVVLSGIVGRYLFKKINRSLREQKRDHRLMHDRIESRKNEMFAACRINEEETDTSQDTPEQGEIPSDMMSACGQWQDEVQALAETEHAIEFFDRLKVLFSRWLQIHYWISGFLFALIIVHVITTLYYGLRWLP